MPKSCSSCEFLVGADCAAPQLIDLSRLVYGEARTGITAPALLLRLNQSVCGSPGFWHVEKAEAPPAAQELPASA